MATQEESEKAELGRYARVSTFFITKLTQLVGVCLGINELAIRSDTSAERMFFVAFMLAGAQGFNSISMYAIDRLSGNGTRKT